MRTTSGSLYIVYLSSTVTFRWLASYACLVYCLLQKTHHSPERRQPTIFFKMYSSVEFPLICLESLKSSSQSDTMMDYRGLNNVGNDSSKVCEFWPFGSCIILNPLRRIVRVLTFQICTSTCLSLSIL